MCQLQGCYLAAAWGGFDLRIAPVLDPDPDDPLWREYSRTRQSGLDHDRRKPTALTSAAPEGWGLVHERRALTKPAALAGVGTALRFASPDDRFELGLFEEECGPRR
jgi:hypothetical protein